MTWWHPGTKFYEDLSIGDRFVSPARTLHEADIHAFAGLSGDFHPYHMNAVEAEQGDFGGRICHGLLSLSVLTGLFVGRLGLFETTGLTFLGLDKLRYYRPVRPGDTVHAELEVVSMRESRSKPDRGIVTFKLEGRNQKSEVFLDCEWLELMAKRIWKDEMEARERQRR